MSKTDTLLVNIYFCFMFNLLLFYILLATKWKVSHGNQGYLMLNTWLHEAIWCHKILLWKNRNQPIDKMPWRLLQLVRTKTEFTCKWWLFLWSFLSCHTCLGHRYIKLINDCFPFCCFPKWSQKGGEIFIHTILILMQSLGHSKCFPIYVALLSSPPHFTVDPYSLTAH